MINLNHESNQKGSKLGIIHSPTLQILSIVLLIVGLVPFLFSINSTAYAFSSGQDASIVLGQSDFTHGSQNQGGGSTPSATSVRFPQGSAFDSSGNLWVADSSNNRVLEYTTPLTTGKAASVVLGQLNFTYGTYNQGGGSTPSAISLSSPHSIAFDSSGNLWVADSGNNRVLEYTTPLTTGKAASVVLGQLNFTYSSANQGGAIPSATTENFLQGIAFDSTGNLWVADSGNNRVLEYTTPLTTGKAASVVLGQLNFTYGQGNQGVSSTPSATTEEFPQGIAFDSSGNLWVGDADNNRVIEYTTPLTTGKAASVVLGQSDFTHRSANQGGSISATGEALPQGIAFDSSNNLWIADSDNNRTLEYTTPLTTGKAASVVLGQSDFTTGSSGLSQNKLNLLLVVFNGPTFDSSGNLWIGDENNNRILEFVRGSSLSVPEFPLGGVVLMFAVSGAAYAAIRYRAMRISAL